MRYVNSIYHQKHVLLAWQLSCDCWWYRDRLKAGGEASIKLTRFTMCGAEASCWTI